MLSMEARMFSRLARKRPNTRTKNPSQKTAPQGLPFGPGFGSFGGVVVFFFFCAATLL
jgi:hypothetical protein